MSKEIVFASQEEALQHLADLTGKRIKIAIDNEEEFDRLNYLHDGLNRAAPKINNAIKEIEFSNLQKAAMQFDKALDDFETTIRHDDEYKHYYEETLALLDSIGQEEELDEYQQQELKNKAVNLHKRVKEDLGKMSQKIIQIEGN